MGKQDKSLKSQNQPYILAFIVLFCAAYVAFLVAPENLFAEFRNAFSQFTAKEGVFATALPLLALVLCGIISANGKARLVFWRWKHPLPGCRAFSHFAIADQRVDVSKLRRLAVVWPETRAEENRVWYGMYKKYENVPKVLDSHRCWLLSRDLAAISFLFFVCGTFGLVLARGDVKWPLTYAFMVLCLYLVLLVVARNHANRFVGNVLTEYIAGEKQDADADGEQKAGGDASHPYRGSI